MSIADIEKVKAAEIAANSARKKADDDAAQIVADGKREAKDLLEKAKLDADALYAKAIGEAEKKAEKSYEAIIAKEEKACEKIKEEGRAKIGKVIDDIVGKVVSI